MRKRTSCGKHVGISLMMVLFLLLNLGLAGCGTPTQPAQPESADPTEAASTAETEETAETTTQEEATQEPAPEPSEAATQAGEKYQASIVLKTTASEYWSYVIAGIEQAQEDLGNIDVVVQGASGDTAFDEQMTIVETLIAAGGMQAIAVAPLNAGMISTQLETADIPILAIDTNFDRASTFIGTAHEDAAYQGGKYVAEKIGEGGKVVMLANIQGETTSEARVAGYVKALEEGGCEIVATLYTEGVADKAVAAMEQALQSQAEIDAVVCCADDVAIGASRAIKSSTRADEDILICGFDGISSGVQAVVDGDIGCTVAQDPYNMGYQCVVSLVDAIEEKSLEAFIDTGCNVITPENAEEYLAKLNGLL